MISASSAETISVGDRAREAQLFVINLCASTSPMALTHPANPELKRYNFFVTRQREDGRERFRLHMGYFASQAEAESLLASVRDVYPAAWAGPAPTSGAPKRSKSVSIPVTAPVPTPAIAATPAVVSAPIVTSVPLASMSNVRAVIDQLSDEPKARTVPTLQPSAPAPSSSPAPFSSPTPAAKVPLLSSSQTLKVLETPAATPVLARAQPATPVRSPSETSRAKVKPARPPRAEEDQVRVVTPEDTQTLRDIRLDVERNAPPCFAVQLVWSVTPVDIKDFPHLAIFDAYTLYNVEGNRQGRRWYGLRLGFFSDPSSATQVAYYVRADYPTVAVVPVAIKEREHANGGEKASGASAPSPAAPMRAESQVRAEKDDMGGFELLRDDRPIPAKRDVEDQPSVARAAPKPAAPLAPPTVAAKATGKRVVARPRPSGKVNPGAATPLEETLEILGASTLTLDESHEIINDSGIRKPIEKKKGPGAGGRFARLLNRLGS